MRQAVFAILAILLPFLQLSAQQGSPAGPVPVDRLGARREALAKRLGTGVAVMRSGVERSIEGSYPQDSDYREDNDFFYLTGVEVPNAWLVLVASDGALAESVLYLPPRDTVTHYRSEQWVGPQLTPGPEATARTGIQDVRSTDRVGRELPALVFGPESAARRGQLFLKPGPGQAESPFLKDTLLAGAQAGAGLRVGDLAVPLSQLRLVKDADELARLRRAIAITGEAHRAAMRRIEPGMYEYQAEALIEYVFRRDGAERLGFPSIVGSGPNSTLLHYDKNRRRMTAGDLAVMDIGAEFGYYTADITRTIPVSGTFTDRQRAIYQLVLGAQQTAIDRVRPGVTVQQLDQAAREYMRANSGTLCGSVTCDRYFVHGLGHWLGMDVHDVGRIDTPLAAGMVLTIEPGIYISTEQLGVRIEDDVLVTADGHEVLSSQVPKRPDEIEAVMREPGNLP
ncbi:MAG TPA: aminopeptidase P N-terminal domain-containing protein [Gemmatimonadales bacterium]|nr:aminopeptidase P N-terminal domain-containing protein [Gemmatimonadales bacterium]